MRIISIASGKGGVGKTTLAANLAAAFYSAYRKNVLLLDSNITTPHLGVMLGLDQIPTTLNHVLKGEAEVGEAVYNHSAGFKIVPSSIPLKDLEGIDVSMLPDVIRQIEDKFTGLIDVLLIDCAPGLGREAMAGIRSSNELLFVATPLLPSVLDVVRCSHYTRDLDTKHMGIALNMVTGKKHELSRKDVESMTGIPVLSQVSSDNSVLQSLGKQGPVTILYPKSRPSREIIKLAGAMLRIPARGP